MPNEVVGYEELADFLTPSACHRGLLPWLRLPATHTPNSANSDGRPAAFVNVCFHAGWFRPYFKMAAFKSMCVPGKVLFLMPEVPFDAAVGDAFPPTPLRKTAFDSPTLKTSSLPG